jgi:peptide/nickel transport system permease protein
VTLGGYVVRRLLQLVPITFGVTILVFFLIHLVPGDPAATILGNQATPARVALLHHQWGLDRPIYVQYGKFMGRVVHGNLGDSLFYSVSAGHLVVQRLPVTLWLIGFGTLLSVLIAVPLAALAATKRDRIPDHVVRAVPLVGLGFPPFWVGIVLLLVFGLHLGRPFPVGGYGNGFAGHLHSMFLPALTVAFGIAPILIRSLRASLLEVLESEYVTMARLKGLPERTVIWRHAVPNAIVPAIQVTALQLAWMAGGVVVVEFVFSYPGIGSLFIDAVDNRDMLVVQAITMLAAAVYVVLNLVADLTTIGVTPRLRTEAR